MPTFGRPSLFTVFKLWALHSIMCYSGSESWLTRSLFAEQATQTIKQTTGMKTQEAKAKASETAPEMQGKAQEMAGEAKGKGVSIHPLLHIEGVIQLDNGC